MQLMNFSFNHDGREWFAESGDISARGASLPELDADIRAKVQRTYPGKNKSFKVTMEFDYRTMPFWLTQYHPYYMHRVLVIET
jgi:hypothetical protein